MRIWCMRMRIRSWFDTVTHTRTAPVTMERLNKMKYLPAICIRMRIILLMGFVSNANCTQRHSDDHCRVYKNRRRHREKEIIWHRASLSQRRERDVVYWRIFFFLFLFFVFKLKAKINLQSGTRSNRLEWQLQGKHCLCMQTQCREKMKQKRNEKRNNNNRWIQALTICGDVDCYTNSHRPTNYTRQNDFNWFASTYVNWLLCVGQRQVSAFGSYRPLHFAYIGCSSGDATDFTVFWSSTQTTAKKTESWNRWFDVSKQKANQSNGAKQLINGHTNHLRGNSFDPKDAIMTVWWSRFAIRCNLFKLVEWQKLVKRNGVVTLASDLLLLLWLSGRVEERQHYLVVFQFRVECHRVAGAQHK